MTKQKKPKVGDTVGWAVINSIGDMAKRRTRNEARKTLRHSINNGMYHPYRLVKIVLSK